MDPKWGTLAVVAIVLSMAISVAVEEYSKDQVKIAAIQVCYAANQPNCDKIWK